MTNRTGDNRSARSASRHELVVVLLYTSYGLTVNSLQRVFTANHVQLALDALSLVHIAVISLFWAYVVSSMWKNDYRATDWGFTLGKGCLVSFGLVAFTLMPFFDQIRFSPLERWIGDPIQILSISVEELVCRSLCIKYLMELLHGKKGKFLLTVVISSLLFTYPHVTTHTIESLFYNVFQMAVVFAIVYYFTKSLLFPLYGHVMLNMGDELALTAGAIAVALYFAVAILGKVLDKKKGIVLPQSG